MPEPDLPPTSWAVLGLLSFGTELSGYDVKKWADASLRFFYWAPAISHVYGELRRLEALGLVSSRQVQPTDTRGKRVYGITAAGQQALTEWVRSPADPPILKHGPALRVWLGHLLEPADLEAILAEHKRWAVDMAEQAEAQEATAQAGMPLPYPLAVLRWSARSYRSEAELADDLLAEARMAAKAGGAGTASRARRRAAAQGPAPSSASTGAKRKRPE